MRNSLEDYLDSADGAASVLAHARLLMKLAGFYETIAPLHLRQGSSLANYKSGKVVIHASNGALATKLRQMAPTLAEEFSKRGVECSGVEVKVQAREIPRQSITSTQKPLSAKTGRELAGLAESLPESSLRNALQTLLARSAIRE